MSHPAQQPEPDLDEDLFDFADVVRASDAEEPEEDLDQIFASFRDVAPAEELLAVPVAGTSPASPSDSAASAPADKRPAPTSAQPAAAAARENEPASRTRTEARSDAHEPVREFFPSPRPRFSRTVVAIALSVTLLNSALAVVVLRKNVPTPALPANSAEAHASAAHAADARAPAAALASLPDPDGLDVAHAHPTLDEARAEIARGEYSAARQRVYTLLAIIDRLENPRRGALEADCQFLIAQSLHLEALARMGASR